MWDPPNPCTPRTPRSSSSSPSEQPCLRFFLPSRARLRGDCPALCSLSGDDRCFLLSISQHGRVHLHGYNDHYMYLNQGQQTIPNGLVRTGRGGGGRGSLWCCPPHGGASPAPTCPGARAQLKPGSVWCPVHLALISGCSRRGRSSQDRPSPSENGASWGVSGLCVDDGLRQFPGHQVAGLWPLWLETLALMPGQREAPGPVRLDARRSGQE